MYTKQDTADANDARTAHVPRGSDQLAYNSPKREPSLDTDSYTATTQTLWPLHSQVDLGAFGLNCCIHCSMNSRLLHNDTAVSTADVYAAMIEERKPRTADNSP